MTEISRNQSKSVEISRNQSKSLRDSRMFWLTYFTHQYLNSKLSNSDLVCKTRHETQVLHTWQTKIYQILRNVEDDRKSFWFQMFDVVFPHHAIVSENGNHQVLCPTVLPFSIFQSFMISSRRCNLMIFSGFHLVSQEWKCFHDLYVELCSIQILTFVLVPLIPKRNFQVMRLNIEFHITLQFSRPSHAKRSF
jgi:hypothetical protein